MLSNVCITTFAKKINFFFFYIPYGFRLCFLFSASFMPGLLRHVLRHFYNEVLPIIVHFLEQRFL